ncbi:dATP/dGTP diphosphohydrolase domain-containing protein [Phenylobacterium sp.]|uniref:dATP/dGTP diphosphohydrolase domain-containing protein n=1 Tax=Phenylobacterium sp. TaxID=1871053 RepID=UPI00395DDDAD
MSEVQLSLFPDLHTALEADGTPVPSTTRLKLLPPADGAPDTNPKTRYGMAKPPIGLVPGTALVQIAESFRLGAQKYGPANWRVDPVSSSTYVNAAMRHLLQWVDGEDTDPESGVSHLAHVAACVCILMDAQTCSTLHDDRPPKAPTGDLIRSLTKPIS